MYIHTYIHKSDDISPLQQVVRGDKKKKICLVRSIRYVEYVLTCTFLMNHQIGLLKSFLSFLTSFSKIQTFKLGNQNKEYLIVAIYNK